MEPLILEMTKVIVIVIVIEVVIKVIVFMESPTTPLGSSFMKHLQIIRAY